MTATNFLKKYHYVVLFALLIGQMTCYDYYEYINMPPKSIHSWRQTDCLSFTLNFYNGRASFTEPCVNNLGITNDGKVASDFPIVQYAVAQLWKYTGVSVFSFRLIELFFLCVGLVYCYKLLLHVTQSNYLVSILTTALIFTSPNLAYYGITTISDIQAFGLCCVAIYFFIKWFNEQRIRNLIIASIVFSLAGLLKMSVAFVYVAVLSFLLAKLFSKNERKKYFTIVSMICFVIPFLAWFAWYYYAQQYNKLHPNPFFLIGILPIHWDDYETNIYVFNELKKYLIPQLLNNFLLMVITGLAIILCFRIKKMEYSLKFLMPIIAFIAYILLFYQVFTVHDYYLINMLSLVILLIVFMVEYFSKIKFTAKINVLIVVLLLLVVIVLTHNTGVKTRARISYQNKWALRHMVLTDAEKNFYNWNLWMETNTFDVLTDPVFNIERIGINKADTILCLGDPTINRSLFQLQRVGYTGFNVSVENLDAFISEKKKIGLKYLILIDASLRTHKNVIPFTTNKLFEYKNVSVYKL